MVMRAEWHVAMGGVDRGVNSSVVTEDVEDRGKGLRSGRLMYVELLASGVELSGTAIVAHIKRTHSLSLSTSVNS